eukprot:Skav230351  [mRNA]  locus=scaffold1251:48883:49684:+ [translate_table: standard]
MEHPLISAMWYDRSCNGMQLIKGCISNFVTGQYKVKCATSLKSGFPSSVRTTKAAPLCLKSRTICLI